MATVNVAALLQKARQKTQDIQKESFANWVFKLSSLKDGDTVEIKPLLPMEGQAFPAELLYVEYDDKNPKNYRSFLSQNSPFTENGNCALVESLVAIESDADAKVEHQTVLSHIKRVKKLLYPVLVVKVNADAVGNVLSYEILENKVQFLELTPNQSASYLAIQEGRALATPDGLGVYSFEHGKLLSVTRSGSGMKDTKYSWAVSAPLTFSAADIAKFNVPVDVEAAIKANVVTDEKANEFITKLLS